MAEDGFKSIVIALVLFVAFTWLILSVAIDFGAEYGRDAQEIGDGSLDVVSFQNSAEGVESSAQSYRSRFESGEVDDIDDASGIFSIATDIINMITTPFSLLSQIAVNIFHVPSLIINVFLGLLAISEYYRAEIRKFRKVKKEDIEKTKIKILKLDEKFFSEIRLRYLGIKPKTTYKTIEVLRKIDFEDIKKLIILYPEYEYLLSGIKYSILYYLSVTEK